jgi:hypothetical protein
VTERTRRRNAQLLEWLRAAAIAGLTWWGMTAMHVQPLWLSAAVGLGAGLIALANTEVGVLLALVGLCAPLIAAQPIVGASVAIIAIFAEHYLGGQGATGFLMIGFAILGALFGPAWAVAASPSNDFQRPEALFRSRGNSSRKTRRSVASSGSRLVPT